MISVTHTDLKQLLQNEEIFFVWRAVFLHLLRVQQQLPEEEKNEFINRKINSLSSFRWHKFKMIFFYKIHNLWREKTMFVQDRSSNGAQTASRWERTSARPASCTSPYLRRWVWAAAGGGSGESSHSDCPRRRRTVPSYLQRSSLWCLIVKIKNKYDLKG